MELEDRRAALFEKKEKKNRETKATNLASLSNFPSNYVAAIAVSRKILLEQRSNSVEMNKIFLSVRFYVKSLLTNVEPQNLPFYHI